MGEAGVDVEVLRALEEAGLDVLDRVLTHDVVLGEFHARLAVGVVVGGSLGVGAV